MKKILALTLSLMLVAALLTGCGAKSESLAGNSAAPESAYDKGLGNGYVTEDSASTENSPEKPELVTSQKLVRKVWITAETDDLDALLQQVDQKFSALGGYAEKREVHNGSPTATRRYRRASLTIRVPAEQLNSFTGELAGMSNITSSTESADDITLSYVATQSRITALETEQTRLLELLAKAETMDDLLRIESRLTDVRTELEQVTSQLRLMDNQVNFATVYLEVSEVKEYTVVTEPETVWDRIGEGFMESLDGVGTIFVELFVFLITGLPYLVIIAVIVVLVVLLQRRRKAKKRNQTPPPTPKN